MVGRFSRVPTDRGAYREPRRGRARDAAADGGLAQPSSFEGKARRSPDTVARRGRLLQHCDPTRRHRRRAEVPNTQVFSLFLSIPGDRGGALRDAVTHLTAMARGGIDRAAALPLSVDAHWLASPPRAMRYATTAAGVAYLDGSSPPAARAKSVCQDTLDAYSRDTLGTALSILYVTTEVRV
jgi:hypothetical protein